MDLASEIEQLHQYSACDISDALLKLKVPGAGFLSDIHPYAPYPPHSSHLSAQPKTIAPASTVLFLAKSSPPADQSPFGPNIPPEKHYVDLTTPGTVVVLSQPAHQTCAVLGGIMATRMKTRGALGAVVSGRIRDTRELRAIDDFPIWAMGTSTVGTGAEAAPWARDVPVEIGKAFVYPGDIVVADPLEGVVCIPLDKLDEVLELLPKLTAADEKVLEFVREGGDVREAFETFR